MTISSVLLRNLRAFQVFGANTDAGKTIFSTILCRRALESQRNEHVWYIKPVSTGADDDADIVHLNKYAQGAITQNFYQFKDPVSPHLAAQSVRFYCETKLKTQAATPVTDQGLLEHLSSQIRSNAQNGGGFCLVETAGGVNSPGPSGTLQAELYRALRLPVVYIADWHLGGISTSISGYESLKMRGYDVAGVAMLKDDYYLNHEYLKQFFDDHKIPFLALSRPPEDRTNDFTAMQEYYSQKDAAGELHGTTFLGTLDEFHDSRITKLQRMGNDAFNCIWWPFTQHKLISPSSITTIDSASGDFFQTLSPDKDTTADMLQPAFDGSASWWTQGLGHANPQLTMAAAYAAGRYGHVMFAEAVNEPALAAAQNILKTVQNERVSKVFYSDNGSTGMEVALKMALKASCDHYGWKRSQGNIEILGMGGSYHGDTIGTMDMAEPSVYNDQIHWYKGRGFWFAPPNVTMRQGEWIIEKPASAQGELGSETRFSSLAEIFDASRDSSNEAALYRKQIQNTLRQLVKSGRRFGALVMESLVLGAGGMVLITLVNVVRENEGLFESKSPAKRGPSAWSGLPVVVDEVFTGLYRLGHASPAKLVGFEPDIAVYAKLLTGGLVPLSMTLASKDIFDAFLSDGKPGALLHGHSYTAHPVGCSVADKSLDILNGLASGDAWSEYRQDWAAAAPLGKKLQNLVAPAPPQIWSVWSHAFVSQLSQLDAVQGVWAMGSVLAVTLKGAGAGGYTSTAAVAVRDALRASGQSGQPAVHCRILGNVLYLMTGQTSAMGDVRRLESQVLEAISWRAV